jgi:hypothetical protein
MYLFREPLFASTFALLLATSVQAQSLDRAGGSPTASSAAGAGYYLTPFSRIPGIYRSVETSPDPLERLTSAGSNMQSRYRGSLEDLARLNTPARVTRTIELRGGTLIPDQENRSRQLPVQDGGFSSFNDPTVQKRLNLTPEQIRQINEANAWSQQQWEEINKTGATDFQAGLKFFQNYQRDYQDRLNKILTPEQLKTWQGMSGDRSRLQPTFSKTTPRR